MRARHWFVASLLALAATPGHALDFTIDATQTGGFTADGGAANLPGFQNYFVGYGTTPGFARTPERRSFFVFDLPDFGGLVLSAAKLELRLPLGGLIFGKGPGTPGVDVIVDDASESFALTVTPLAPALVLLPGIDPGSATMVFDLLGTSLPAAAPTVFVKGSELPDPGDGGPPIVPIVFEGGGLAALAAKSGGAVVLGGWMPSWSFDDRLDPMPPPLYLEASELIFGLSDVHAMPILTPKLTLTLVPEPSSLWQALAGIVLLAPWLYRRRAIDSCRSV